MRHVKGKLQADKKYIQELAEKYPTASNRPRLTERGRMTAQWKEQQWLGSQGAASCLVFSASTFCDQGNVFL